MLVKVLNLLIQLLEVGSYLLIHLLLLHLHRLDLRQTFFPVQLIRRHLRQLRLSPHAITD